jgi:hypothetical protein
MPPKPEPAEYGPARRVGSQDRAAAARRTATGRLVEELVDWRPWEEYRERYLSECNDGINDPEPCELRLVDLAAPSPLEHPIVAAMLRELSEYAAEARHPLLKDQAGMGRLALDCRGRSGLGDRDLVDSCGSASGRPCHRSARRCARAARRDEGAWCGRGVGPAGRRAQAVTAPFEALRSPA